MATSPKRFFEDLAIGERRESSRVIVTLDQLLTFAREYDPQYFHTDPQAARASIFGEVVASGIYTLALWRRLDHEIAHDIAWICGVGWENARWPNPVRAGDTLRATSECLAKRLSSTGNRGVVEYRYTLLNGRDDVAFTCRSINLVELRPAPEV